MVYNISLKKEKNPFWDFICSKLLVCLDVNLHIFMNSKKVPCHNNFYLKNSALNSRMESMWKLIIFPLYLSWFGLFGFKTRPQETTKRYKVVGSTCTAGGSRESHVTTSAPRCARTDADPSWSLLGKMGRGPQTQ